MRLQIIDNNIVINTIDDESAEKVQQFYPDNLVTPDEQAGIGWTWDGTKLNPPPVLPMQPVDIISMRQARLQLIALDQYDAVNAAINNMSQTAQVEWEYATEIQRRNPLVSAMQQLLGWSEDETDNYFIEAAKL